ncbi:hypothetical protein H920_12680 [Fukomys damarensis]|uniref:Uncharacterized protein n=1 Tax=Fukomys damarensis TaxID=885580 RepID=A0A091D1D7_FUKDA|nr:hypothetical protein H920_12680 [Fukomys damarensis]
MMNSNVKDKLGTEEDPRSPTHLYTHGRKVDVPKRSERALSWDEEDPECVDTMMQFHRRPEGDTEGETLTESSARPAGKEPDSRQLLFLTRSLLGLGQLQVRVASFLLPDGEAETLEPENEGSEEPGGARKRSVMTSNRASPKGGMVGIRTGEHGQAGTRSGT